MFPLKATLFTLTTALVSSTFINISAYAIDQTKFDQAKSLYDQRSFRDPAKIPNAEQAAKIFEQVLPTVTNDLERAKVETYIARSYFAAGDAIKDDENQQLRLQKIPLMDAAVQASERALTLLGFPNARNAQQPDWTAFSGRLTAPEQRAVAVDATYYLAAAFGKWGSTMKKEHGLLWSAREMPALLAKLIQVTLGLGQLDAEAYNYGSKRISGRLLDTLRYDFASKALVTITPLKYEQTITFLREALDKTLIPNLPAEVKVSRFGFNNTSIADALYADSNKANGNAKDVLKTRAVKLMTDLIQVYESNPGQFDPAFAPENEDAVAYAKEQLAKWK